MGIPAYKAVWKHSKSKGSARLVMLCLAEYANSDGVCWPSVPTISDMTGVSERQVTRALQSLRDDLKEIEYTPGDGRGNSSHYRILLMTKGDTMSPIPSKKGDICDKNHDTMSPLEDIKDDAVSSFPNKRMTSDPIKGDTMSPDPIRDPERRREEYIYAHDAPEQIAEMITELAVAVKTPYGVGVNEDEFDSAATLLVSKNVTREQVAEFGAWWATNGYYPGKPALKSLMQEIDNAVNGVNSRASPNGHHKQAVPKVAQEQPDPETGLF